MNKPRPSLADMLPIKTMIDVVDIGANPIDETPPYKGLLDAGRARVVGFEPNGEALARLNAAKSKNETYLPDAVYDGTEQELRICHAPGMTSLLEPDPAVLSLFHGFTEWGRVVRRERIDTVRLDDVAAIRNMDYLKIDIQGAELGVFQNGTERLKDCLAIHTEVEFLPMYKGQPLFSEVEMFLRQQGFMIHTFSNVQIRAVQPMIVGGDPKRGLDQLFWADAIFIRDLTKLDALSPLQLKKLALILHDVYGAYDVVLNVLMAHDAQQKSRLAPQYAEKVARM